MAKDLQELSHQNILAALFNKDENATIIQNCSNRLQDAMTKFDVSIL
jgi:hypothetical protein